MDTKGRVKGIQRDFLTKKYQLIIEVDCFNPEEKMEGEKRITIKDYRRKRSLDANAYSWVLYGLIAAELGTTAGEIHEEMLQRYGLLDRDDAGWITITVRADIDKSHLPGHWKLDGERSTLDWHVFRKIKGTSEYDTKEMSYFLDRVIEEAQALGIETATPDELERIKHYAEQRTR